METQATGSAQAQTPAPVQQHPIIEEKSIVDRLTKYVRDNPDNDPNKGTDLEEPQQEALAEGKPEEKVEAKPEENQEKVEFDEESPIFDLEYSTEKGKEQKKLSLKDLREGYLAKQDYHRNIQKVKQQEAQLNQQVEQARSQVLQQAAQQLEIYRQAVVKLAAPEILNVDLNKLAEQDPTEAQRIFFKQIELNKTLASIQQEQAKIQQANQYQQKQAMEKAIVSAKETLEADIPGWNEQVYTKVLENVAQDYGFKGEEVAPVVDARLIKVFHDAYQYRQLQKAKPEISKKVVAVPKVVKPGSGEATNPASEATQQLERTFKKSGDWRDAAKLYLARQKQKK